MDQQKTVFAQCPSWFVVQQQLQSRAASQSPSLPPWALREIGQPAIICKIIILAFMV